MTPCEREGYKEGDVFKVKDRLNSQYYKAGDELVLTYDDGSYAPMFNNMTQGIDSLYVFLDAIEAMNHG